MKKILFFHLFLLSFISCSKDEFLFIRELSSDEQIRVSEFERNYINHLIINSKSKSDSKDEIFLIGYKTISYHGTDSIFVNVLWETFKKEIEAQGSFLTLDGRARIYFPMSDAIVKCNGTKYIADSNGVISCPNSNLDDVTVVGREKTEKSIFTKFRHPYSPNNFFKQEKVLVFDLGSRPVCGSMSAHHENHSYSGRGVIGVPCIENHQPYSNCTVAYMIAQPRCTTSYDRCMDYNGFGTDCSGDGYFLGSDCSIAMAQGHCWNEVMD